MKEWGSCSFPLGSILPDSDISAEPAEGELIQKLYFSEKERGLLLVVVKIQGYMLLMKTV